MDVFSFLFANSWITGWPKTETGCLELADLSLDVADMATTN
jgi:hypothetical protein